MQKNVLWTSISNQETGTITTTIEEFVLSDDIYATRVFILRMSLTLRVILALAGVICCCLKLIAFSYN